MKSVEEIYGEMLDCFAQRTGMRPAEGCDLAARLYAVAAQVYSLYVQADWAGRQVLPQTAEGEFLDRHAQLRGITRKEAAPATGVIRFTAGETADAARTIPVGTVCMTAGRVRFETTEEGTIQPGELTADVPAQAAEAGSAGNVAAGSVVVMAVAPAGVAACTNPEPCTGGADRETDEGLRERVMDSFRRLPNGANAAFYQREALSFPQIAAASVIPRPRGIGTVDVIAATRAGVPDEALLAQLTDHLQSRREIAVEVQVKAPTLSTVTMYLQLKPKEGYTFAQVAAGEALDGAFGALEEVERESSLLTARSWGLEGLAALLLHRPAAETEEGLGQALAALLRIGDDSFTPEAINDTIVGCGVAAECTETGVGRVRVRFPGVVGVPAQIDRLKQIIQEIVPPQVEIEWFYRFLTWGELEEQFASWEALESAGMNWSELETNVLP